MLIGTVLARLNCLVEHLHSYSGGPSNVTIQDGGESYIPLEMELELPQHSEIVEVQPGAEMYLTTNRLHDSVPMQIQMTPDEHDVMAAISDDTLCARSIR